jgi:hypothetical protein
MKPIKLTAIIFAGVVTVLATALVFSLISYSSKQQSQKPSAPAAVENNPSKPIQPSKPVAEKLRAGMYNQRLIKSTSFLWTFLLAARVFIDSPV